ncbi:MAG: 6,7-dimethyl-8-ribityllumazine synthase [Candidatus Hydrothermales bacterium]
MAEIYGNLKVNKNDKFCIIVSRFHSHITFEMLRGAREFLKRCGAEEDQIDVFIVPGSLEIVSAFSFLKNKFPERYNAFLVIGAIVEGETEHHTHVARESIKNVIEIAKEKEIPLGMAIITLSDTLQGIERSGGKLGNRGENAAATMLELLRLKDKIKEL